MDYNLDQKSMRKTSKEVTAKSEIEDIIKRSQVCRIAACKNNIPYIIPLSFGFDGLNLFVHTATEGRKIDFWETNPLICFEFDIDVNTIPDLQKACKWSTSYRSVIGYGKISEISDEKEKFIALNCIMEHYSGKSWEFDHKDLKTVKLWKIIILDLTAKKSNLD
jgi:uncharacterized protein